MKTEIGEYIVGAYLKIIQECDVVSYNVRPPGGGLDGLGELDVVGFRFDKGLVFICEVATHIRGVLYKDTMQKVTDKHQRQKQYAERYLNQFKDIRFSFWSPVVPVGKARELQALTGLEMVVNAEYASRIDQLQARAKTMTEETNNPFFRTLQILARLRRKPLPEGD